MALFDVGDDLGAASRHRRHPEARTAAAEVIAQGAEVILGPLFGPGVAAVSPLATQADIRVLAFSNDASVARRHFLLGFRPEEQVRRVIDYALAAAPLRPEPEPLPRRMRPQRLPRKRRPDMEQPTLAQPPPTRAC